MKKLIPNQLPNEGKRPIASSPGAVQFALCFAVFLLPFMGSSLNLAMTAVVKDFNLSAYGLTFLVSAYLVGTAMVQMPAARVADLLGRRRVLLVGLVLFTLFTLLGAWSWSGTFLVLFRFGAGVGAGLVFATNMAILTAVFPKERRGAALGVNTATVYLAVAIGPFVGGVMSHHLGWRSIFYVATGLGAVAILAAHLAIKDEWAEAKGETFAWRDSAVYAMAIGSAVFGFSLLSSRWGVVLLALGLAAAVVFVKMEVRARRPIVRIDLLRSNRNFSLASLSAMINYAASFAVGFTISLYLQYVKGMPADQAGFLMMAQPAAQTLLSPLAGRWSDRVNPSYLTTIGMGLIALNLFALSFFGVDTPTPIVVLTLVLIGVGFALFSSPNVNIIMGSVSSRLAGVASATTGTVRQIGQSLSIALVSLIIHAYMGDLEPSVEAKLQLLPAIQTGFLVFSIVCLAGVYASGAKLMGGRAGKEWRHLSGRITEKDGGEGKGGEKVD